MSRVRAVALRYRAGELATGELPMAAAELVADGYESPALYDLAGRGRREAASELEPLLREALDELGVPFPSCADGERWWLRELAGRVGEGSLAPGEFAEAVMYRESFGASQEDEEALLGLLSDYCSCCVGHWPPEVFVVWEAEVRVAAAAMAARTPLP
ncbi:hypothetical protein ACFYS8_00945 [Kitasatospora sp. NPDC004615]|uniref:hypothetical protein n=1 Tax=Kitasatospora sp. NPDC004615 TaxID=3364017 RepID=UPI0036A70824